MSYTAWSVVFGEQPTAAKWNQLGQNDAGFKDGTNIDDNAIINRHMADDSVTGDNLSLTTYTNELAVSYTSGSSAGTYYDTGVKVTLAAAGTYLFIASGRISTSVAGNYGYWRLYNQTTSAAVSPVRLGVYLSGTVGDTTVPIVAIVTTTTTNNIIRLEIAPGGAYTVRAVADVAGATGILAVRIG